MKRPLCVICLVFMVCMVCWGKQRNGSPFTLSKEQSSAIYYIGNIQKKEYKNNQIYLYLSNVLFLNPTSDLSNQIKNYQKGSSHIGCICYLDLAEKTEEENVPKIGATVCVKGIAMEFTPATNLGMFDQKEYYFEKGIHFAIYQAFVCEESVTYNHIQEGLFRLRQKIANILTEELGEKKGGILRAMLLGDKEELLPEIKQGYQYSGIAHILAISGLHISILGFGFFKSLQRCRIPIIPSACISFFFLITYAVMVGGSVATLRALIMFLMFIGSKITKHPYDIATSISVAGSILLGINGGNLDVGFLLSFSAIMGMVFLTPVFYEVFPLWLPKKIKGIRKGLFSGAAILLTSVPILETYFFGVAPLSIIVNLIVIPCMSILIISGVFLVMTQMSLPFLSFVFRIPCEFILGFYEKIIYVSEKIPGYFLVTGQLSSARIFLYYGILILLVLLKKKIKKRGKLGILCIMLAILIIRLQSNLQVEVLDVGQGDGIYIETGTGYSLFIDGGSTTVKEVGKYRIAPYLKAKGVCKIDYLFFTHYDEDHISGWVELFEEMLQFSQKRNVLEVTNIVISKETKNAEGGEYLLSLARKLEIQICMMEQGDVMDFRGVTIYCVYPGDKLTESPNANSLVLLLRKDKFSMLLTGDLEGEGEVLVTEQLNKLYKEKERESIEVLKVGHHGSKNASSYEFLEEVDAPIGVISYGRNNSYGHPATETLMRFETEGMQYLGTGTEGAILIETDGNRYWLESFLE